MNTKKNTPVSKINRSQHTRNIELQEFMDYLFLVLYLVLPSLIAIHLLSATNKRSESNKKNLPPGPWPIPIFGNLVRHGDKPHVGLTQLAEKHGPLMTLQLGQVQTVVISSASMAKEALKTHDISFCNRRTVDVFHAERYNENSAVWLPVGPQWRNIRKFCTVHILSTARLVSSERLRRNKVNDLIAYVQKCNESGLSVDIGQAVFTTSLNLLSCTFFSEDLGDPNSELAREFKTTIRALMEEAGKLNFANYFPILRKIDLQGGRRRASVHMKKIINIFNNLIDQRLKGKRVSNSLQDIDILDVLLGFDNDGAHKIETSKIPFLLLVKLTPTIFS